MDAAGDVEEIELFAAIQASGARVLLIGRRALVALGLPVATFDYDLWIAFEDVEKLNVALGAIHHVANRTPEEARARGRYVIENGEHIDVLVARSSSATDGTTLTFDEAWSRRLALPLSGDVIIQVPSVDDLITTKRWALRAKDVADIQLLEEMKRLRGLS